MEPKNIHLTYLYSVTDQYQKNIMRMILDGTRIDKNSEDFKEIAYDVKRRSKASVISNVLNSENVVFVYSTMPMPRTCKVFTAKDIKAGKDAKHKVFIDISDIARYNNGTLILKEIDILIAYINTAMVHLLYFQNAKLLLMSTSVASISCEAFTDLFTYIIDFLYKVSNTENKKKFTMYLAAKYYSVNILNRDSDSDSTNNIAKKISGITDREIDIINIYLADDEIFKDIKSFIDGLSKVLKIDIKLDLFIEKWMFLYGAGTQFSLELFTSFAEMLINANSGTYLNNQKTIERVAGKNVDEFNRVILTVGGNNIG